MRFNPLIHHRRSLRLRGYDYSRPGCYFVTLCTKERGTLFGGIENGQMILNDLGHAIEKEWSLLPLHFDKVELDLMIVMPDHFHGIIMITGRGGVIPPMKGSKITGRGGVIPPMKEEKGATTAPLRRPTLGKIIAYFKYQTTKIVNARFFDNPEKKLWQRNYFERIVRDESELSRLRKYIADNPIRWSPDDVEIENLKMDVGAGSSRPKDKRIQKHGRDDRAPTPDDTYENRIVEQSQVIPENVLGKGLSRPSKQ